MKKLILIRHAKSSWESELKDLERPLSKRGINDSKIMSDVVNNVCKEVEIVFCSVARRASETCNIFMKNVDLQLQQKGCCRCRGPRPLIYDHHI